MCTGVVIWELVTGQVPERGRLRKPVAPTECPAVIADLIEACLTHDPGARPSARQVYDCLMARWVLPSLLAGSRLHTGSNPLHRAKGYLDRGLRFCNCFWTAAQPTRHWLHCRTLPHSLSLRLSRSPTGAPPGIKSAATAPPAGPGLSCGSTAGTTKPYFGWSSRTASAPTETLPNPDVMFGSADSGSTCAPPSSDAEARFGSVSSAAYSGAPNAPPPSVASAGPREHSEARATRRYEAVKSAPEECGSLAHADASLHIR